jgi:hypothetical protein
MRRSPFEYCKEYEVVKRQPNRSSHGGSFKSPCAIAHKTGTRECILNETINALHALLSPPVPMTPTPFHVKRARRVMKAEKDAESQTEIVKPEQYH